MTIEPTLPRDQRHDAAIRVGGFSLIVAAVAFMAVFTYLAGEFDYPDVLDGHAADVLPALLATGNVGRAVWALYALLPLLWIPAALGAFHALPRERGLMRAATLFACVSSVALILGLMRWPSFQWELARVWVAQPSARPALEAVFNAANTYLGNYVGEFLGELCFSLFFLLSATAMSKRDSGFPRWIGWLGITTGALGLVGMFRNVSHLVAPVAEVNNYLLPLWMIVFGVGLLRSTRTSLPVPITPAPAAV